MSSKKIPTTPLPPTLNGRSVTAPLLLGTELVRAEVAARVGLADVEGLGDAPGGGPITWALFVDGRCVARTDEAMTDDGPQDWARRLLGADTRFHLAHRAGGHWFAETARPDEATTGATTRWSS